MNGIGGIVWYMLYVWPMSILYKYALYTKIVKSVKKAKQFGFIVFSLSTLEIRPRGPKIACFIVLSQKSA